MPADLDSWKNILELLSYAAVILGVPGALYQYYRATKRERLDREYGTYHALDDKYLHYLEICLANPELDIFDTADANPRTDLTSDQLKKEEISFSILVSLFERAFLMYHGHSEEIRKRQWSGWDSYITEFCRRPNFRRIWDMSGMTFDAEFEAYMKETLLREETAATRLR